MFTSDNEKKNGRLMKSALADLLFAAFCALFGAIYESFSFGVFSFFMIYAFAFPLAAGIFLLIFCIRGKELPRTFTLLLNASAATAAVGSLAAGVVEIYGSGNRLLIIYAIAAGALFVGSFISLTANKIKEARAAKQIGENGQ